ncbi:hypothetical protein FSP39_005763 [Pinctada imbricata]|uniref:TGF-beta family profile domain-containing protein n=2 Tax=Pinctada TaxID=50425 RepID=A0AA88YWY0_PINIB|nr:myostatin [Pinctada fucata]KAK3108333.1 hypothetical protein FSP39_005763 [Pinctada imbricata]
MYSVFPLMFYLFYLVSQFEKSHVLSQQIRLEDIHQYDTSNVNDSVIRSVFAQNVEANETIGNPRCKSCHIREQQKRKRIESIKNKITHALKFDIHGLPNITDARIPRVPSYQRLLERYDLMNNANVQADSPYRSSLEDQMEEYGRTERTYMLGKSVPSWTNVEERDTVYFDTPQLVNEEIRRALLWIYVNPENQDFRVPNNVTEIYLYSLVPPGKNGRAPVRNYLMRRKRRPHQTVGWHHFDITWLVALWTRHPSRNLGLVVEAKDVNDYNMIVFPGATGDNFGLEPTLDMKTDIYLGTHRSKRSVNLRCNEEDQVESCCRYPLTVDFIEFGWDFVIAPIRYAAYYCAGECENEHMDENPHTRVLQEVDHSNTPRALPCCTPTRLSHLSMLYFDHQARIRMTLLPRMKVERCACQ